MESLLQQLDERQRRLLIACLAALVVAAAFAYGVLPQIRELRALFDNLEVMQRVTSAEDGASGEIDRLNQEMEALRKQLQGDMANLPRRQIESFIIGRLQTISWRNEVALVSVEPAQGEPVEMYRELLFRVELSGDYFALLDWLTDVSSELGFVVIKEFQLGVSEPDPRNPRLATRLMLAAYQVTAS